jgi:hypothetical protein
LLREKLAKKKGQLYSLMIPEEFIRSKGLTHCLVLGESNKQPLLCASVFCCHRRLAINVDSGKRRPSLRNGQEISRRRHYLTKYHHLLESRHHCKQVHRINHQVLPPVNLQSSMFNLSKRSKYLLCQNLSQSTNDKRKKEAVSAAGGRKCLTRAGAEERVSDAGFENISLSSNQDIMPILREIVKI